MAKEFNQQLREAIEKSGMSQYRLAQLSGVPASQLSRFVAGKAGLAIDTIDAVCAVLKLRLVKPPKPASNKRSKKPKPNR